MASSRSPKGSMRAMLSPRGGSGSKKNGKQILGKQLYDVLLNGTPAEFVAAVEPNTTEQLVLTADSLADAIRIWRDKSDAGKDEEHKLQAADSAFRELRKSLAGRDAKSVLGKKTYHVVVETKLDGPALVDALGVKDEEQAAEVADRLISSVACWKAKDLKDEGKEGKEGSRAQKVARAQTAVAAITAAYHSLQERGERLENLAAASARMELAAAEFADLCTALRQKSERG